MFEAQQAANKAGLKFEQQQQMQTAAAQSDALVPADALLTSGADVTLRDDMSLGHRIVNDVKNSALGQLASGAWGLIGTIGKAVGFAMLPPLASAAGEAAANWLDKKAYDFGQWAGANGHTTLSSWFQKGYDYLGERGRNALHNGVVAAVSAVPSAVYDWNYQRQQQKEYEQAQAKHAIEQLQKKQQNDRENMAIYQKYLQDVENNKTEELNAAAKDLKANRDEDIRIENVKAENARRQKDYDDKEQYRRNVEDWKVAVDEIRSQNFDNDQELKRYLVQKGYDDRMWDAWERVARNNGKTVRDIVMGSTDIAFVNGANLTMDMADALRATFSRGIEDTFMINHYAAYQNPYMIPTMNPKFESEERREIPKTYIPKLVAKPVFKEFVADPEPPPPSTLNATPNFDKFKANDLPAIMARGTENIGAIKRVNPLELQAAIVSAERDMNKYVAEENVGGTSRPLNVARIPFTSPRQLSRLTVAPMQGLTAMRVNFNRIPPPTRTPEQYRPGVSPVRPAKRARRK